MLGIRCLQTNMKRSLCIACARAGLVTGVRALQPCCNLVLGTCVALPASHANCGRPPQDKIQNVRPPKPHGRLDPTWHTAWLCRGCCSLGSKELKCFTPLQFSRRSDSTSSEICMDVSSPMPSSCVVSGTTSTPPVHLECVPKGPA